MICHACAACVFEAVLHDPGREEMDKYIHTIAEFFTAGSCRVPGLERIFCLTEVGQFLRHEVNLD